MPTRLNPAEDEVDMVIAAGRMATRLTPEFNGVVASLAGHDVAGRIEDGIVAGGRRGMPLH